MSSVSHIRGHISFFQLCDGSFEVSGTEKYDRQISCFFCSIHNYAQVCNIQSYDTFSTRQKTCTHCTKRNIYIKINNNKNSDDYDDDDHDGRSKVYL